MKTQYAITLQNPLASGSDGTWRMDVLFEGFAGAVPLAQPSLESFVTADEGSVSENPGRVSASVSGGKAITPSQNGGGASLEQTKKPPMAVGVTVQTVEAHVHQADAGGQDKFSDTDDSIVISDDDFSETSDEEGDSLRLRHLPGRKDGLITSTVSGNAGREKENCSAAGVETACTDEGLDSTRDAVGRTFFAPSQIISPSDVQDRALAPDAIAASPLLSSEGAIKAQAAAAIAPAASMTPRANPPAAIERSPDSIASLTCEDLDAEDASDSSFDESEAALQGSSGEDMEDDSDGYEVDVPYPPCSIIHKTRKTFKDSLCEECHHKYRRDLEQAGVSQSAVESSAVQHRKREGARQRPRTRDAEAAGETRVMDDAPGMKHGKARSVCIDSGLGDGKKRRTAEGTPPASAAARDEPCPLQAKASADVDSKCKGKSGEPARSKRRLDKDASSTTNQQRPAQQRESHDGSVGHDRASDTGRRPSYAQDREEWRFSPQELEHSLPVPTTTKLSSSRGSATGTWLGEDHESQGTGDAHDATRATGDRGTPTASEHAVSTCDTFRIGGQVGSASVRSMSPPAPMPKDGTAYSSSFGRHTAVVGLNVASKKLAVQRTGGTGTGARSDVRSGPKSAPGAVRRTRPCWGLSGPDQFKAIATASVPRTCWRDERITPPSMDPPCKGDDGTACATGTASVLYEATRHPSVVRSTYDNKFYLWKNGKVHSETPYERFSEQKRSSSGKIPPPEEAGIPNPPPRGATKASRLATKSATIAQESSGMSRPGLKTNEVAVLSAVQKIKTPSRVGTTSKNKPPGRTAPPSKSKSTPFFAQTKPIEMRSKKSIPARPQPPSQARTAQSSAIRAPQLAQGHLSSAAQPCTLGQGRARPPSMAQQASRSSSNPCRARASLKKGTSRNIDGIMVRKDTSGLLPSIPSFETGLTNWCANGTKEGCTIRWAVEVQQGRPKDGLCIPGGANALPKRSGWKGGRAGRPVPDTRSACARAGTSKLYVDPAEDSSVDTEELLAAETPRDGAGADPSSTRKEKLPPSPSEKAEPDLALSQRAPEPARDSTRHRDTLTPAAVSTSTSLQTSLPTVPAEATAKASSAQGLQSPLPLTETAMTGLAPVPESLVRVRDPNCEPRERALSSLPSPKEPGETAASGVAERNTSAQALAPAETRTDPVLGGAIDGSNEDEEQTPALSSPSKGPHEPSPLSASSTVVATLNVAEARARSEDVVLLSEGLAECVHEPLHSKADAVAKDLAMGTPVQAAERLADIAPDKSNIGPVKHGTNDTASSDDCECMEGSASPGSRSPVKDATASVRTSGSNPEVDQPETRNGVPVCDDRCDVGHKTAEAPLTAPESPEAPWPSDPVREGGGDEEQGRELLQSMMMAGCMADGHDTLPPQVREEDPAATSVPRPDADEALNDRVAESVRRAGDGGRTNENASPADQVGPPANAGVEGGHKGDVAHDAEDEHDSSDLDDVEELLADYQLYCQSPPGVDDLEEAPKPPESCAAPATEEGVTGLTRASSLKQPEVCQLSRSEFESLDRDVESETKTNAGSRPLTWTKSRRLGGGAPSTSCGHTPDAAVPSLGRELYVACGSAEDGRGGASEHRGVPIDASGDAVPRVTWCAPKRVVVPPYSGQASPERRAQDGERSAEVQDAMAEILRLPSRVKELLGKSPSDLRQGEQAPRQEPQGAWRQPGQLVQGPQRQQFILSPSSGGAEGVSGGTGVGLQGAEYPGDSVGEAPDQADVCDQFQLLLQRSRREYAAQNEEKPAIQETNLKSGVEERQHGQERSTDRSKNKQGPVRAERNRDDKGSLPRTLVVEARRAPNHRHAEDNRGIDRPPQTSPCSGSSSSSRSRIRSDSRDVSPRGREASYRRRDCTRDRRPHSSDSEHRHSDVKHRRSRPSSRNSRSRSRERGRDFDRHRFGRDRRVGCDDAYDHRWTGDYKRHGHRYAAYKSDERYERTLSRRGRSRSPTRGNR